MALLELMIRVVPSDYRKKFQIFGDIGQFFLEFDVHCPARRLHSGIIRSSNRIFSEYLKLFPEGSALFASKVQKLILLKDASPIHSSTNPASALHITIKTYVINPFKN